MQWAITSPKFCSIISWNISGNPNFRPVHKVIASQSFLFWFGHVWGMTWIFIELSPSSSTVESAEICAAVAASIGNDDAAPPPKIT